mmetsp:Transcript_34099/g.30865  ORF Transcript_34099/g.30865 Transcript_34099/m.30865 type:complete len:145 (-) Transcript_34099:343-777(-)
MDKIISKIKDNKDIILKYSGIIGGAAVTLGSLFYFYHGLHDPIILARNNLSAKSFLYKEFACDFKDIAKNVEAGMATLKELDVDALAFLAGFDNPGTIKDRSKMRWAIGVAVDKEFAEKVAEFLKKHEDWKSKELPECDAIRTN